MNPIRRSMTDALKPPTPEILDIIAEGTPKPVTTAQTAALPPKSVPQARNAVSLTSDEPGPTAPKKTALKAAKAAVTPEGEGGHTVQLGFHVPSKLPLALLKASAERKARKIRPYTQQDIVAEALSEWLEKNGYTSGE